MEPRPPQRVLIIGCGYLGTRVAAHLRDAGARVTATTTRPERMPELAALGLEPALLDVGRTTGAAVLGERFDAVLHAVAPGSGDAETAFHLGPLACARRLAEAAEGLRWVLVSSTGVYAQRDGSWVDETSPAEPTEERHRALRRGEEALLALGREAGFAASVLRLGGLYGPGRSPVEWLRRPEMRERVLRGGREAFMSWIRVEDASRAAYLALTQARGGQVYLAVDDEPVRRGDFYAEAAAVAGLAPLELPSTPGELGKRCANRKIRSELGFRPTFPSYREGLRSLQ